MSSAPDHGLDRARFSEAVRGNHPTMAGWEGAEGSYSGQVACPRSTRAGRCSSGLEAQTTHYILCGTAKEHCCWINRLGRGVTHGRELQEHAAICIKTDGKRPGFFALEGSQSAGACMSEGARSIETRRATPKGIRAGPTRREFARDKPTRTAKNCASAGLAHERLSVRHDYTRCRHLVVLSSTSHTKAKMMAGIYTTLYTTHGLHIFPILDFTYAVTL